MEFPPQILSFFLGIRSLRFAVQQLTGVDTKSNPNFTIDSGHGISENEHAAWGAPLTSRTLGRLRILKGDVVPNLFGLWLIENWINWTQQLTWKIFEFHRETDLKH